MYILLKSAEDIKQPQLLSRRHLYLKGKAQVLNHYNLGQCSIFSAVYYLVFHRGTSNKTNVLWFLISRIFFWLRGDWHLYSMKVQEGSKIDEWLSFFKIFKTYHSDFAWGSVQRNNELESHNNLWYVVVLSAEYPLYTLYTFMYLKKKMYWGSKCRVTTCL